MDLPLVQTSWANYWKRVIQPAKRCFSGQVKVHAEGTSPARRGKFKAASCVFDQCSMNAAALNELLSEQARVERAKKAGEVGGKATPEQIQNRLVIASFAKRSEPREKSRTQAAKASSVSERKVRQAQTITKASPGLRKKKRQGPQTLPFLHPQSAWRLSLFVGLPPECCEPNQSCAE